MLSLTCELSLLAGCLWQWSLMNRRADRNDFLLLHKFHDLKYICPEKQPRGSKKIDAVEAEASDDEDEERPAENTTTTGRKKVRNRDTSETTNGKIRTRRCIVSSVVSSRIMGR